MSYLTEIRPVDPERVQRIRAKLIDTLPEVCFERACLMTESYRQTAAYPEVIRRAMALDKILSEMTIFIEDEELIVGNTTGKRRGGPLTPEVNWEWSKEQVEAPSSQWDEFALIPPEDIEKMKPVFAYWDGHGLSDKLNARISPEVMAAHHASDLPAGSSISNNHIGSHMAVDYAWVLAEGLEGVIRRAEEKRAALDDCDPENFDKLYFYDAALISLKAAIKFSNRHADLAEKMAGETTDPVRAAELRRIAEVCRHVPEKPARNFFEALESVWMVYIVLMIEGWGPGMALGRMDQYLYPYYKKSMEDGSITREEAQELISMVCIKLNQSCTRFSFETMKTAAGLSVLSDITLGGVTKDGKDAANELSYVFLDAEDAVAMFAEEFVIRVNKVTSDDFLLRACKTARKLKGKLKFIGDEAAIKQLMADGKPEEAARDFILSGCALPTVPGFALDIIGGQFNLPLMLELALNDGKSRLSGKQIGLKTGNPRLFRSLDDVWQAYVRQVEHFLRVYVEVRNVDRTLYAHYLPTPFQSACVPACLDKGRDITDGGTAPYITDGISIVGGANVADSFAAMQNMVFEKGKISMDQLIDALDSDFGGDEGEIVLSWPSRAPKYGNDDDYVDHYMVDIFEHIRRELSRYKGANGNNYAISSYVASGNLMMGAEVGALPDGRRAGTSLCEGGLSPYPGRNINGATSTINSVTKVNIPSLTAGAALNMKFSPDALSNDEKLKKFASLMRTYFAKGGYHVQYNIVSTDMLRDAQKHPEKYRDLLVRVATYSAFFVDLGPECQQEVIDRMEFSET